MEKRKIKNNNNYPKKLKIMSPLNYSVLLCGYIYVVIILILIIMGNLDVIGDSKYATAYKIAIAIGGLFFGSSMKNLYSFLLNSISQKQYTEMQETIQQSVKTFEAITSLLQIITISLSILALVSNTFAIIILFFFGVVAFLNYILGLIEL
ncbi:hypothetical protein CYK06_10850 [Staphylococcus hominis]|uniref:hypothetical protein n=1 Tax=Staphylococcus hominis TaxID=1290 RepID=UPI000C7D8D0F|nr:hypothetical protein [Staphylococcus hominis]PLA22466.1 hypothetical protein CYK06_10850 [Staphylococcus hominis]